MFFSAKASWDLLKLTPERRDTSDGRKKLIHQPRPKWKVGKKWVIIDVKITKHQYLHDFRKERVTQEEEETIYIKEQYGGGGWSLLPARCKRFFSHPPP